MRHHVRPLILCITALAVLLCIASCSKDDPAQPNTSIHQSYEIEYDVQRNRTTGRAAFRANSASGTQAQLTPPAAVLYNGTAMNWNNAEPYGYTLIENGRVEAALFEFTDAAGTVRTNSATLASVPTIDLPAGVNELIVSSQATIAWQGAPVGAGETVSLIFNTAANGLATYFQQSPGATSIILTPTDLAILGAGTATWRLERFVDLGLQSGTTAGGQIRVRWSTGDRPVTLK